MTIAKIMPNKTLILTCNSSFGLANFRMNLIRRLQADGYHIVAIAPQDTHSAKLEAAGVEFYDWNLKARSTSLWTEILAIFQLVRLYGIIKPDLCFHYTVKAVIYGAIAARLTKVNFVSVITGLGYVFLNRGVIPWLVKSLYRFILRYSSRTLFLNKSDRQEFLLLGLVKPDVAIVIPGEGIDVDFFCLLLAQTRGWVMYLNFLLFQDYLLTKELLSLLRLSDLCGRKVLSSVDAYWAREDWKILPRLMMH